MNPSAVETANPAEELLTPIPGGSLKAAETLVRAAGLEPARAAAPQILRLPESLEKSMGVRRNGPFRHHRESMGYAESANFPGPVAHARAA